MSRLLYPMSYGPNIRRSRAAVRAVPMFQAARRGGLTSLAR